MDLNERIDIIMKINNLDKGKFIIEITDSSVEMVIGSTKIYLNKELLEKDTIFGVITVNFFGKNLKFSIDYSDFEKPMKIILTEQRINIFDKGVQLSSIPEDEILTLIKVKEFNFYISSLRSKLVYVSIGGSNDYNKFDIKDSFSIIEDFKIKYNQLMEFL